MPACRLLHLHFGDPEVEDLDDDVVFVLLGQKQIGRLDVAMNHVRFVRLLQATTSLRHDPQRDPRRDRSRALEQLCRIDTRHQLHGEIRTAGGGIDPRVDDLDQVLRVNRARGARLALKALDRVRLLGQSLGDDHLHRNAARGSEMDRLVDLSHSPSTELADDLVAAIDNLTNHDLRA